MAIAKKLTPEKAALLLPAFAVGLVYDKVIIDTPNQNAGKQASVGLDLKTTRVVLHPEDYLRLQEEVVQFFLNRPHRVTEQHTKARILDVWPTPTPDQAPVQGDPSSLPASRPVEL